MRYILCIILFFIGRISNAQTIISFNDSVYSRATPPQKNVEEVNDGIIVTYKIDNAIIQQDLLYPECSMWKILGFRQNNLLGKPAIPFRWDSFAIPTDIGISIEILDTTYTDIPMQLSPSRPFLLEKDTIGYTLDNVKPIISFDGLYPEKIVETSLKNDYRGKRLLKVLISPLQYNYNENRVRVYTMIKYKIKYKFLRTSFNPISKIDMNDSFLSNISHVSNVTSSTYAISAKNIANAVSINRDYLILTDSTFTQAANKLAEWKRTIGYRTHVVILNRKSVEETKETIRDWYRRDSINLYYLTIIGTSANIRTEFINDNYNSYKTDFNYACLGGENDAIPDLYFGRLPVRNTEEADIVVNKIISYEKNPILDSVFYNNAINCAYFYDTYDTIKNHEDYWFVFTLEKIRQYFKQQNKTAKPLYRTSNNVVPLCWRMNEPSFGDSIPIELRKPNYEWKNRESDICRSLNQGAFCAFYRGHGETTEWLLPHFRTRNIDTLHNERKLPVVFSIACKTGDYNNTESGSFTQSFLSNKNGGAVAVYAATGYSNRISNDVLLEGMIDAIWPNPGFSIRIGRTTTETRVPVYELGQIMNIGMQRVDEYSIADVKSFKELYHCFGDPSMQIYTKCPSIIRTPNICRIDSTIYVEMQDSAARIAFYTPESQHVDTYYGTKVEYTTTADSVVICITRHNHVPYITHSNELVYIQNEIINNDTIYKGGVIKMGRNVTEKKNSGNVTLNYGNIVVIGRQVELQSGVKVSKGTTLRITPP